MLSPSHEQQAVLDAVRDGFNVIVDAVAGSGKTTTVLSLAKSLPDRKILQITYNSALKIEVRAKAIQYDIANLEVHTYHSLAVRYYDRKAHTDEAMRKMLRQSRPAEKTAKTAKPAGATKMPQWPPFDIVVIDESQDMSMLYFHLVNRVFEDIGKPVQVVVLGDRWQSIYEFKSADSRFLTHAKQIYPSMNFNTVSLPLHESYRLTDSMAWFVNDVMIGSHRVNAKKPGVPIAYYRHNAFEVHTLILRDLGAFRPDDIFVLAPSLKSENSPVRKLENAMVNAGVPCFVPISDDSRLDEDLMRGKVVFSSFHQSKGRERPIVIVYGFDDSYFTYYGRTKPRTVCPPELYVAATRASRKLILIEDPKKGPLPFFKMDLMREACENSDSLVIKGSGCTGSPKKPWGSEDAEGGADAGSGGQHVIPVTNLVRFIKDEHMGALAAAVDCLFTVTQEPIGKVSIPSKVATENGMSEDVSDLNGLTIPAIWEASKNRCGATTLHECIEKQRDHLIPGTYLSGLIEKVRLPCETEAEYLYLANVYGALKDGYYFKTAQIKNYDWLTPDMVKACTCHLDKHIPSGAEFERTLINITCKTQQDIVYYSQKYGSIALAGRVDAVTDDTLWEFKCVDSLSIEHLLQVVVYAWMWKAGVEPVDGPRRVACMNIRTGEIRELDTNSYLIEEVMSLLLENRYGQSETLSDAKFIGKCRSFTNIAKESQEAP